MQNVLATEKKSSPFQKSKEVDSSHSKEKYSKKGSKEASH